MSTLLTHYNLQMKIAIGFKVDNERAIKLYEKMGLEKIDENKTYYIMVKYK